MGPHLRERQSGGTERGAAPAPPTRGGGTELAPFAAPSAGPFGGSEARGNPGDDRTVARRGTGERTGEYDEGAGPDGPRGTRPSGPAPSHGVTARVRARAPRNSVPCRTRTPVGARPAVGTAGLSGGRSPAPGGAGTAPRGRRPGSART